jgi:hypothetical protein
MFLKKYIQNNIALDNFFFLKKNGSLLFDKLTHPTLTRALNWVGARAKCYNWLKENTLVKK